MSGTSHRPLGVFAAAVALACALIGFAPAAAYAEAAPEPTILDDTATEWGAPDTEAWYITPEGGLTIGSRVTCAGEVHLILRDDTTLTVSEGITVPEGSGLTIEGQAAGTGSLVAGGDETPDGSAGIGGDLRQGSGRITIADGVVTATGAGGGAGIGGGSSGTGNVTVSGGTVTAIGSDSNTGSGTGIGGGAYRAGTVLVSGGHITARGGRKAADIGGGYHARGAVQTVITITGGTVDTDEGNDGAPALGNEKGSSAAASIVITGGSVNAVVTNAAVTNGVKEVTRKQVAADEFAQFTAEYPSYGTNDMVTDAAGKYYVWVAPEDAKKPEDPATPPAGGTDDPADDNPAGDDPSDDNPGDNNPGTDDPADDDPGGDDPADDDPGDDDPGDDDPADEDPGTGDPGKPDGGDVDTGEHTPAAPVEMPQLPAPKADNLPADVPSSRADGSALVENTPRGDQAQRVEAEPLPQTGDGNAQGGEAMPLCLAILGLAMFATAEKERTCAR